MQEHVDVANITAVLLYVTPGFLAVQLRYFVVPGRKGSDFELLGWSVFISVVGYGGACLVTIARCGREWQGAAGFAHWDFVVIQWALALLVGYAIARITSWPLTTRLLRKARVDYSQFPSVWNETWQRPQGAPWVIVRMTDGSVCCGAVLKYTRDPAEAEREFYLFPVFSLDDDGRPKEQIAGTGVFVRAAQVVSVEVLDAS